MALSLSNQDVAGLDEVAHKILTRLDEYQSRLDVPIPYRVYLALMRRRGVLTDDANLAFERTEHHVNGDQSIRFAGI